MKEWVKAEQELDGALSEISTDSELWQARGYARFQQSNQGKDRDKLKQAISDYQQALKANQDNGLARAQLAVALVLSRQFKEAVACYDQAVERDKKNPELLLKRVQALMQSDDRRIDRAYADCLTEGQLFRDRQRFDDAERAYGNAVNLFKEGVESSRKRQAQVYADLAEVQEKRATMTGNVAGNRELYLAACKNFLEATNLDGAVVTYWGGLARCHQQLAKWNEARQAYEKALQLNPGDPILTVSLANSLVKLKDWEKAAESYLKIIQSQPKVLWYRLRLAEIYLQPIPPEKEVRAARLEAARLCLAEAVKDEFLAKQSILWSHLAVIEVAAGKIADYQATRTGMFEAFKTPLGNDANSVAWTAAFAKDTPEGAERAIKLAVKAVSVAPQNFNYLNTYGAVLYRGDKREEAIKTLEEATNRRALANLPSDQLAYGNALDLQFKAMAQYPDQPEQARQTLKLAVQTIDRVKPAQQSENPEESLARVWERLEVEVLRREAESLINR